MAMWNTFSGPVSRRRNGRIRTEQRVATKGWRRRTGQEHFATCRRSKSDPHALPETAAQIDMTGSRSLNLDRPAYRGGPAKPEKRKDNRAGRRTRSRRKSKQKRAQIDEKTSKIRRKIDEKSFWGNLERSRIIRKRPGRLRNGPGARKSRLGTVLGSPLTAPGPSRKRPGSVLKAPGTPLGRLRVLFGRVRGAVHCRNASRIGFSSFLSRRAKARKCFAYHVLQCFVARGRRKQRTGGKGAEARKSRVFSLQN